MVEPWLVVGDFNSILSASYRQGVPCFLVLGISRSLILWSYAALWMSPSLARNLLGQEMACKLGWTVPLLIPIGLEATWSLQRSISISSSLITNLLCFAPFTRCFRLTLNLLAFCLLGFPMQALNMLFPPLGVQVPNLLRI
ncbi:hypothetical protein LINPERHAP2_LOCUS3275 [Linum perenne]